MDASIQALFLLSFVSLWQNSIPFNPKPTIQLVVYINEVDTHIPPIVSSVVTYHNNQSDGVLSMTSLEVETIPINAQTEDAYDSIRSICSRVPVNTTAVINSASSCELTASLSSITYRQNIPHVARLKNRCPGADSWRNTVSLERNIERFTQDILKKLHVEGVQYLIMFHSNRSDSFVKEGITNATMLLFRKLTLLDYEDFLNVSETNDTLKLKQYRTQFRTYLLLLTTNSLPLINVARSAGIIGPLYNWIVINLGVRVTDIQPLLRQGDNMVIIDTAPSIHLPIDVPDMWRENPTISSIILTSHAISQQIASNVNLTYFRTPCSVKENSISGICGVIKEKFAESLYTDIWTTENSKAGVTLNRAYMWSYKMNSSFPPIYLINSFSGFYGKQFNITTRENKIFQIKKWVNSTSYYYTGLAFDILNELARTLNFTYVITEPPDGQYGVQDETGRWIGMVGMVHRKEVDFAVGSFTITMQRDTVVDFTTPFWRASSAMVYRTGSGDNKMLVYLRPFRDNVWLCIACALVAYAFVAWLIHQLVLWGHFGCGGASPVKIWMFYWYWLGMLVNQGSVWWPRRGSSRIIFSAWWFFSIVLSATYTGNLVASLTVPKVSSPIDSLSDLAQQNTYTTGLVKGVALHQVLMNSPFGVYHEIWKQVLAEEGNLVDELEDGFERVLEGNYVFMEDYKNVWSLVAAANRCDLYIPREKFLYSGYAFPLQPDAPYMDLFNRQIFKMIDSGLIDHWKQKYWPRNDKCSKDARSGPHPASLADTQGAFVLLVAGLALGTILLLFETLKQSWNCKFKFKFFS